MKKKFLIAMLVIVVLCLGLTLSACEKGGNVFDAGTFESSFKDNWTADSNTDSAYYTLFDYTVDSGVSIEDYEFDGTQSNYNEYIFIKKYSKFVRVGGSVEVVVGLTAKATVEQYSVYKVSCNIYVPNDITNSSGVPNTGVYLTISELNGATPINIKTSNEDFTEYSFYVRTNDYNSLTVKFGIGSTSGSALGNGYIDDINIVKCTSAPANVLVYSAGTTVSNVYRTNTNGNVYIILTSILGAVLIVGAFFLLRKAFKNKVATVIDDKGTYTNSVGFWNKPAVALSGVLLISFAIRLLISNFIYGYIPGVKAISGIVSNLLEEGLEYFTASGATLVETGSLYIMWALGAIADALGIQSGAIGFSIFMKIPTIVADIVGVFFIFTIANKRYNASTAAIFAGLYGVLPVFFTASSAWGTYMSVGMLFMMIALYYMVNKKFVYSAVFYILALLFSAYSLLLLPLILVYEVYIFIKQPDKRNSIVISATAAFIVFYCITVPFARSYFTLGKPFYIFEVYWNMFTQNSHFAVNAFNIYAMCGVNMQTANGAANGISIAFTVILLLYSIFLFVKRKDDMGRRDALNIVLIASFVIAAFAMFTTRNEVFTMMPALALMLMYSVFRCDKRILIVFGVYATTMLINSAYVMNVSGYIGQLANSYEVVLSNVDPVMIVFSVINVLNTAFFAYASYDICANGKMLPLINR